MQVDDFPGCCGISIINELSDHGWNEATREYEEPTSEKFQALLKEALEDTEGTLILATTIATQHKEICWLRKAGFKQLKRFRNANTDNLVTIWYRFR